jgi:D-inositol-3-phosphate glycosyltransferase
MIAEQHNTKEVANATGREDWIQGAASVRKPALPLSKAQSELALLTGGWDKPYALGLALALASRGICLDFVGSDDLAARDLLHNARVNFLNLRGSPKEQASAVTKFASLTRYYWRLIRYAVGAQPKLFHILWNNKFQLFDRTLLTLYYVLLGKKIVLTAHNVNAGKRDSNDTVLNRLSLRVHYKLSHHIFVHTELMKRELVEEFRVPENKVSVIPFGINNTFPKTKLATIDAKRQVGVTTKHKTLLFFGCIAPYKGLEYLIAALTALSKMDRTYRLIIAGGPKRPLDYWKTIRQMIVGNKLSDLTIERIGFVPDEQVELYFKAADVLILPYTHIFQSGVLFLGYSFGLPTIAADVGSLREEIIDGETGFVFKPRNSSDLAHKIDTYFNGQLFRNLETRRAEIKKYANERYSWDKVAATTATVYSRLLASDL